MPDSYFSPFDPPLSPFCITLPEETIAFHLNNLHATHWNAVYARITQETRCRTSVHLAAWLEADVQEVRRVLREETLPLEWLNRLCFRGWLNPSWILYGLPQRKYLPYKVPTRNSAMGRNLEHRIWATASDVERTTRSSAAILFTVVGNWEKMEELREGFQARRPKWAKTFLMAELWKGEDGQRVRTRRVFLKWSSHSKNSFQELRKAAGLFASTAFLADGPKEWEHVKSYGAEEGAGRIGYLADSDYERPGWKVRKIYICSGTDVRLEWDAKE